MVALVAKQAFKPLKKLPTPNSFYGEQKAEAGSKTAAVAGRADI